MRRCLKKYSIARIPRAAEAVPRDAHRARAFPGEIAPSQGLEGHRVQHDVRRHLQRAAAIVGAAARLALDGVLPASRSRRDSLHFVDGDRRRSSTRAASGSRIELNRSSTPGMRLPLWRPDQHVVHLRADGALVGGERRLVEDQVDRFGRPVDTSRAAPSRSAGRSPCGARQRPAGRPRSRRSGRSDRPGRVASGRVFFWIQSKACSSSGPQSSS